MLRMNSKKHSWRTACSKSLLVMFIAQLLLSAACITTANADSLSHMASATAHCHNVAMPMAGEHAGDKQTMPACTHCDVPDMGMSYHVADAVDMVSVLLAVIALPEAASLLTSDVSSTIDDSTLPHSFSLLYQTTQRILI